VGVTQNPWILAGEGVRRGPRPNLHAPKFHPRSVRARQRTGEGRDRAKAKGIKFGRKPKLNKYQQQEARARRDAGETSMDIARTFGVSHMTIARLVQEPALAAEQS
jgi:hypothetical protein